MPINRIHSFLVYPAKNDEEQPEISGTNVLARERLHGMLTGIYERAQEECDIDIIFKPNDDGEQQNDCRDLLVEYSRNPSMPNGRRIAARLQEVSTHRSGLGLLFLIKGTDNGVHRLVISRFPADQGVIAQARAQRLSVQFIEQIFMKSAKAYKSALYATEALTRGFWDGKAVDRQISGPREASDYWIQEFLKSDLRTTGPAGTRRLAKAIKDAIKTEEISEIRHELISAASLLSNRRARAQSARQVIDQLGLTDGALRAVETCFPRPDLMDEVFQFDRDEFNRNVPYRAVALDNGGMLIAENNSFPQIFREQVINERQRMVRYTTEGRIVAEQLRKRK